jgi:LPS-assembly lipoprotein
MAGTSPAMTIGGMVVMALCLGACGFHPLYGDSGATAQTAGKLAMIYVDPIPDSKLGYELRNELIDLFDASGDPSKNVYRLRVTVGTKSEGVAIQNDAAITRYNDTLTVTYSLSDAKGQVITRGTETGLSAYNVVTSPYATLVAQQSADKNAAVDIAYRIRTDLAVYFAQTEQARPLPPKK